MTVSWEQLRTKLNSILDSSDEIDMIHFVLKQRSFGNKKRNIVIQESDGEVIAEIIDLE